jgi:hypothetical protein
MNGDHVLEAFPVANEHVLTGVIVAVLGASQQLVGVRRRVRHERTLSVEVTIGKVSLSQDKFRKGMV